MDGRPKDNGINNKTYTAGKQDRPFVGGGIDSKRDGARVGMCAANREVAPNQPAHEDQRGEHLPGGCRGDRARLGARAEDQLNVVIDIMTSDRLGVPLTPAVRFFVKLYKGLAYKG